VQSFLLVSAVPHFDVDFDLPPRQRWVGVASHYKAELIAMTGASQVAILALIGSEAREDFLEHVHFDAEILEELQGIVNTVNHTSVTVDNLKCLNMIYEMQSPVACSGVLWALPNGTVMHGRNMDYVMHFLMPDGRLLNLPDVTFTATTRKEKKILYTQVGWPGFVGIPTAMRHGGHEKHGGWAFEQNSRVSKNEWRSNLEAAKKGGKLFMLEARRIMETTPDFSTAVEKLYATKFIAPSYFVVSGSGRLQGAVLTVDRLGERESDTPPMQNLTNSTWHLVQTNDDLLGLPLDARLPLANEMLNESKQEEGSVDHLMQFMHTTPLFIPLTVFSTVMVPATGYFKVVLPSEPPQVQVGVTMMQVAPQQIAAPKRMPKNGATEKQKLSLLSKNTRPTTRMTKFLAQDDTISLLQLSLKLRKRHSRIEI
jgi:hypothetical protein